MKKMLFTFVLTMLSAQVVDAASGSYAGVSAGQSRLSSDACDGLPISCDFSDTGWKIFVGYQATKNFGLEVSFIDFGEFTATGPGGTATIEFSGFSFVGTGTVPVSERFGLFGKVGLLGWDSEAHLSGIWLGEDDGTELTYGVGATVKVTEHVDIRVEWEQFADLDEDDMRLLSAGVVLSF